MSYCTLAANAGWLKNVTLKTTAANGITAADLTAAQAAAAARIDAELAAVYDVAPWAADTPPIIAHVAELLAAADVLDMKYERGDTVDGDDANLPARLRERAERLIGRLKGDGPPLDVVRADGSVQPRRALVGRALPTGSSEESRFSGAI